MRIRQIAISLLSVFVMGVSTTVGFASTSVSAATVGTGVCTSTVDNATGVTMAEVSGECVLSFTRVGATVWTVPNGVTSVRTLVVGAGGGGSADQGGGGGGGQVVDSSSIAAAGNVTISVGAGGAAGYNRVGNATNGGRAGSTSSFVSSQATVNAKGGSGSTGRTGANNLNADGTANNTGYTGGGGSYGTGANTGTGGALFMGGGGGGGGTNGGGGGGGAGGVGQPRSSTANGGVGLSSNITGATVFYGGGGGGSTYVSTVGAGGNGGGGNGGRTVVNGVAGVNGLGGGGGGGGDQANNGGAGGSGVVIVRYSMPVIPSNSGAPVVSGTPQTGSTLTTSNGTWTGPPTSYVYRWMRSATSTGVYTDIAATSSSYVVTEGDVGYFIKVSVTGTNGLGSASATSAATSAVVDIVPTNTALPVVSGTARTGATLSTTNGSWTSSPSSFEYQWKRSNTASGVYTDITSATSRTYELTDADIDKYIKVSIIASNSVGASSAELSAATSIVLDLTDSVVPTTTTPVATATGFTFSISNYSNSYTYAVSTTKGTVSRSTDDVTVTGLAAGESATVTIAVTRTNYKPGSKTVSGSATPPTTTTTAAPALSIVIQAPVTTVAQGQASVATLAPTTTTLPVLGANGVPVPTTTTTTVAPVNSKAVVSTTLPKMVTTTTVGPPVVDKVDAGQTAVQVDGVKTDAVVTRDNNQMVVTAGSLSATMSGLDKTGKRSPLDSDGNIHLAAGDEIKISVGGFKPGSLVEVWLFSTPTQLGTAVVGADGTVSGTYRLPAGTKSGTHRVVVTARLANGKPTSFTLGILVGDISTTSTLTRVLIAIPITLAIGFGFILPTQLRRRRKTRTT